MKRYLLDLKISVSVLNSRFDHNEYRKTNHWLTTNSTRLVWSRATDTIELYIGLFWKAFFEVYNKKQNGSYSLFFKDSVLVQSHWHMFYCVWLGLFQKVPCVWNHSKWVNWTKASSEATSYHHLSSSGLEEFKLRLRPKDDVTLFSMTNPFKLKCQNMQLS